MLFIFIIDITIFFFKYISLYIKLGSGFLFKLLSIFLIRVGLNYLYKFLLIFLLRVGPNSEFSPIFLSKIGPNPLYKFLPILFVFKKLSFMLLFIFKRCLLLAKSLLSFDFLSFLSLSFS